MTPHAANGAIASIGVTLRLQEPKAKEGEALLRMPVMEVSVPTMAYRAADIEASDAAGRLALSDFDEPPTSKGIDRQYRVHRATVGDVTARYTGKPRQVDARTRIDAQLREKSGGKRSLDDLVLEVQARQKAGKQVGNPQWRAIAVRELGEQGGREFDNMVAGRDIVPPANAFAPCLKPVAYQIKPFQLGFDEYSFGQVKNLKAGTAAAAAGVQEGDMILKLPDLKAARADSERPITLQLQRGAQVLEVSYAPSGPQVQAWRWQRTAAAENGDCAL